MADLATPVDQATAFHVTRIALVEALVALVLDTVVSPPNGFILPLPQRLTLIGSGDDYCGDGCQSDFGTCGSTESTPATSASAAQIQPEATTAADAAGASQSSGSKGTPTSNGGCSSISGVGSFATHVVYDFSTLSALPPELTSIPESEPKEHGKYSRTYDPELVNVTDGAAMLTVPGGQNQSPIRGAMMQTVEEHIKYASVRTTAILTSTKGVCNGFFFFGGDNGQEIDIEYLSDPTSVSNTAAAEQDSDSGDTSLFFTNHEAEGSDNTADATAPIPADATSTPHEYRIDWTESAVNFFVDDKNVGKLTEYVPKEDGPWIWNNWADGDQAWTVGPPADTAVLQIQKIEIFSLANLLDTFLATSQLSLSKLFDYLSHDLVHRRYSSSNMPKRKHQKAAAQDNSSDTDSLINVDFEFFPPAEPDYHGLKSLLTQLFHTSAPSLPLHNIADAIIDQPVLGTCVKCEDEEHTAEENDPFAFLAVVDLWERRDEDGVKQIVQWLRKKCDAGLQDVKRLLEGMTETKRVGLVLSERLVNMPPAVAPALWRLLNDEITSATADDPYYFTHFLVISKTYVEVASTLPSMDLDSDSDEDPSRKSKKARKGKDKRQKDGKDGDMLFFHPEDEVLLRFAAAQGGFAYDNEEVGSEDRTRAFAESGIKPKGLMCLIERERLEDVVRAVAEYITGEADGDAG
ncbi:MAG: hypothetical protein Q9162_000216 [Coniocarpon cinnabarinum]